MEADTRRRVKPQPKPNSKSFRVERCDITNDSQSDDDVCDALLNPSSTDKELNRLVDPRQRRSSEYEERALASQRGTTVVVVTDPQCSSGDSCLTPLLKKSILKESGRKAFLEDKMVTTTTMGGVIPKGLRRAFSVHQDSRTNEVKSILNKRLSPTLPEKGEHVSRPIQRKPSKPEPMKAFVRFGETITVPSTGSSLSPGLMTRHNFLQQRASFQSDTGKLAQPLSGAANNGGSSLLQQDAGIVCSNNDLRLILCDAKQQRRHSADVRREKMKTNRSLSFDSSIFRLRKNSSTEPPILYSKHSVIASTTATATTATVCSAAIKPPLQLDTDSEVETSDQENQQKHVIQILITSDSPDQEHLQELEDATSPTADTSASASRRSSNCSNAEVAVQSPLLSPDPNRLSVEEGFKVPWDDSSVVDATILGNAIETYLTGGGRRLSAESPQHQPKDIPMQESSLRSSLKSLFVK